MRHLIAQNADDLTVISAMLQDAAIKVGDLAYLAPERRIVFVCNRFHWEEGLVGKPSGRGERRRAGFHLDGVLEARFRNLPLGDPDHVLSLLSITTEPGDDGAATITFTFSGNAALQAEVECIDAALDDISGPWRALARPHHPDADDG